MAQVFKAQPGADQGASGGALFLPRSEVRPQRERLDPLTDAGTQEAEPFHTLLRAYRERAGLTQTALAGKIQRSTSLISLLESGQRRPTKDNIGEFARALALSRDEESVLYRAAGFASSDMQGAVHRIVDMMTTELGLDDADQLIFSADLVALISGWQSLFASARHYEQGQFEAAGDQLANTMRHAEHSPTLRAYAELYRAATLTQLGELKQAEGVMRDARRAVEKLDAVPDWAPALRAEACGTQGMLALRLGQYQMARALIAQGVSIYEGMLKGKGTPQEKSIGYQGLGRSNKRLAELSLFEGQPAEAFRYCVSAEAYLRMAHPSTQRDHWLRRTNELMAWALTEMGDFAEASELRAVVRDECEAAGDSYGVTRNALYMADDRCRQLRAALDDAGLPSVRDPDERWRILTHVLSSDAAAAWLDEAYSSCVEALASLERAGQKILLGHCLRTLGILLHYRAVLHGDAAGDEEAYVLLNRALTVESAIGQERRVPIMYESLAEIDWDRGRLPSAISYYAAVLQSLDQPLIISTDAGSEALRDRALAALKLLAEGAPEVPRPPAIRGSEAWQALSRQLIEAVQHYVQAHATEPLARSDRDPSWLKCMADLDCDEGRRILAQNKLSASLALALPAGYVPEAADIHQQRFITFEERVRRATDPAGRDLNHDLCCRPVVERGVAHLEMRSLVREQMRRASEYLACPHGYLLDAGQYMLPLAFAVKRDHVLIEVPSELATRFMGSASGVPDADPVCYAIHDAAFARSLSELFDALVDEARQSVATRETTREWLVRVADSSVVAASYPY